MNTVLAIVGLPGAGKSETAQLCLATRKFPGHVYFGNVVLDRLKAEGLPLTQEYEQPMREKLRKEHGMGVIAELSMPEINRLYKTGNVLVESLYSTEEYEIIKEVYGNNFKVLAVYAPQSLRIIHLGNRPERPLTPREVIERDMSQIKNLNQSGPIALADYTIINTSSREELKDKVNDALIELGILEDVKYVLFVGLPYAGKTTQCNKAVSKFPQFKVLSTSQILKANPEHPTHFDGAPCRVKDITLWGGLVPDDTVLELVKKYLENNRHPYQVSDSWPRTIVQLEDMKKRGLQPSLIVYLAFANDEELSEHQRKRMSLRQYCQPCNTSYDPITNPSYVKDLCNLCGKSLIKRKDDNEESLQGRMNQYREDNVPLIERLREEFPSRFLEIDAKLHPDDIFSIIRPHIQKISKQ